MKWRKHTFWKYFIPLNVEFSFKLVALERDWEKKKKNNASEVCLIPLTHFCEYRFCLSSFEEDFERRALCEILMNTNSFKGPAPCFLWQSTPSTYPTSVPGPGLRRQSRKPVRKHASSIQTPVPSAWDLNMQICKCSAVKMLTAANSPEAKLSDFSTE